MSGKQLTKSTLGLVASASYRKGNAPRNRSLSRLILAHKLAFTSHYAYVTRGTYNDAIGHVTYSREEPWLPKLEGWEGEALRMGKEGGIIQLAGLIERSTSVDRRVDVLIFLAHPDDVEENYPEDVAMVRSAIRNNIIFLSTFRTVNIWATNECETLRKLPSKADISSTYFYPSFSSEDTLALIAHNKKKLELLRWVVRHRRRLGQFRRIIATGTTGGWVQDFLHAADVEVEVDPRYSGPEGGDIEIANAVLDGNCQHVVFFVDPSTSHPHQADIQALLRVCAMDKIEVNLRLNETSADSWISTVPKVPEVNSVRPSAKWAVRDKEESHG